MEARRAGQRSGMVSRLQEAAPSSAAVQQQQGARRALLHTHLGCSECSMTGVL